MPSAASSTASRTRASAASAAASAAASSRSCSAAASATTPCRGRRRGAGRVKTQARSFRPRARRTTQQTTCVPRARARARAAHLQHLFGEPAGVALLAVAVLVPARVEAFDEGILHRLPHGGATLLQRCARADRERGQRRDAEQAAKETSVSARPSVIARCVRPATRGRERMQAGVHACPCAPVRAGARGHTAPGQSARRASARSGAQRHSRCAHRQE